MDIDIFSLMYVLTSIGTSLGLVLDASNDEHHISTVIIGSLLIGIFWPALWAAKITQKLAE